MLVSAGGTDVYQAPPRLKRSAENGFITGSDMTLTLQLPVARPGFVSGHPSALQGMCDTHVILSCGLCSAVLDQQSGTTDQTRVLCRSASCATRIHPVHACRMRNASAFSQQNAGSGCDGHVNGRSGGNGSGSGSEVNDRSRSSRSV